MALGVGSGGLACAVRPRPLARSRPCRVAAVGSPVAAAKAVHVITTEHLPHSYDDFVRCLDLIVRMLTPPLAPTLALNTPATPDRENSKNKLLVIDYYADWWVLSEAPFHHFPASIANPLATCRCGPCKLMAPLVEVGKRSPRTVLCD